MAGAVCETSRREFVAGITLTVLALSGCGGDEDEPGAPAAPRTRTVQDAMGSTEIPNAPKRVIADSVSTYAQLVSLGITPIAVALPEGISPDYISADAGKMRNVVGDDGWTVDVERALELQPDLVVAVGADYNLENCERYRTALPTLCFKDVYTDGSADDVKATLDGIAAALGRKAEAQKAAAEYDRHLAEVREKVQASPLKDQRVGLLRFDKDGWAGIRTGDSGTAVLSELGVQGPTWPKPTVDGYVEISEENLGLLDRADLLLVTTDDDVVVENLRMLKSPLWKRLAVVSEGRTRFVGAWNGGDLPQLHQILDDVEEKVLATA
jgi:iron complex transport system substrate-binding protein